MRILFTVAALFCVGSVDAAVQVVSLHEAPSLANFSGREVPLRQFNPALGLLQSVSIELKGTGSFIQAFNHPNGSGPHRDLSGQENLTLTLGLAGEGELLTLTQHAGHRRLPGQSTGTRVEPVSATGQRVLTSDDQLTEFTGCGLVDLFLSARSGLGHVSPGGMNILTGLWTAGADIVVTYNYTAVPECATWLTGVVAVLVLLGTRKKGFSVRS